MFYDHIQIQAGLDRALVVSASTKAGSQSSLAAQLGVSPAAISQWASGTAPLPEARARELRRLGGRARFDAVLLASDQAWNPASTKRLIYGPGVVAYERHADGGIDAKHTWSWPSSSASLPTPDEPHMTELEARRRMGSALGLGENVSPARLRDLSERDQLMLVFIEERRPVLAARVSQLGLLG